VLVEISFLSLGSDLQLVETGSQRDELGSVLVEHDFLLRGIGVAAMGRL